MAFLTLLCIGNTIVAIVDPDWPPIHHDKAITIIFPWLLWATYVGIESYDAIVVWWRRRTFNALGRPHFTADFFLVLGFGLVIGCALGFGVVYEVLR